MTTIIVISHNSSVIINHPTDEGGGLGDDEDHEKVSNTTYDPSQSSQSSSSSTPDAPFITSRTLEKMNLEMRSQGKKSLPRRRLKDSLSTLESDSEDLTVTTEASSSADSTLSSTGYNILSSITYFPSLQEETFMKTSSPALDKMFSTSTPCQSASHKMNDRHPGGLKLFVDHRPGRGDLKTCPGPSSAGSLDRRKANIHLPASIKQPRSLSVTQIMPGNGTSSTLMAKKIVPASISSFCTLTRRAPRMLPDPEASKHFKISQSSPNVDTSDSISWRTSGFSPPSGSDKNNDFYSVIKKKTKPLGSDDKQNGPAQSLNTHGKSSSVQIRVRVRCDTPEKFKKVRASPDLPSSDIDSEHKLAFSSSGSRLKLNKSDLGTIQGSREDIKHLQTTLTSTSCSSIDSSGSSSSFRPIGAVLPTGWHRHPLHHPFQHHSLPMRRPLNLDDDHDQDPRRQLRLFDQPAQEDCWFLDANFTSLQVKDDDQLDLNDNLKSWQSLRREATDSALGSSTRTRAKQGINFNPATVLSSRILRRHTTYIKSGEEVNASEAASGTDLKPIHIHSWHTKGSKSEELGGSKKRRKQVNDRAWSRGSSLRHHLRHRSFSSSRIDLIAGSNDKENGIQKYELGEDITITDEFDPDNLSHTGNDVGRIGTWAVDFEKLLADPLGLRTFAEFLKKEFSHENIYFWTACEKYRRLASDSQLESRRKIARDIIRRHLSSGAPEPVNVDSHARQVAIDGLDLAHPSLFSTAQKQIYNLMKFDSFSRFLKSELYNECLMAEMNGKPLKFESNDSDPNLDLGTFEDLNSAVQKSKLDIIEVDFGYPVSESSRRRNLLSSWSNLRGNGHTKSRVKIKERHDMKIWDEHRKLSNESGDFSSCKLTRIIFPDKATTVVEAQKDESIRSMVSRLLEKRGLRITSFDVFKTEGSEKPLDLSADCSTLGCTEVKVEPRVLFRVELPSRKSIGVKAKPSKLVKDVLGPILQQYEWNLDNCSIQRECDFKTGNLVQLTDTVASIDNSRLIVLQKQSEPLNDNEKKDGNLTLAGMEELGQKTSPKLKPQLPMDSPGKEVVSGPFQIQTGRKLPKPPGKASTGRLLPGLHPVVADDLFEGLKLAQRGRLNDQRGTEIKFEMPDFLKRQPDKGTLTRTRQSEPNLTGNKSNGIPFQLKTNSPRDGMLFAMKSLERGFNSIRDGFPGSGMRSSDNELTRDHHGNSLYDPIYETLSTFGHHNSNPWSLNPSKGSYSLRGDPPPLPPKPKLIRPDFLQNVEQFRRSRLEGGNCQRDERGISVSLV